MLADVYYSLYELYKDCADVFPAGHPKKTKYLRKALEMRRLAKRYR